MSQHKSDADIIASTHNTARFFTENRHVAWIVLAGTVLWGVFGYVRMPQRKDPDIPVRAALAMCFWPGVGAEKVEQLVTQRIEEAIAQNVHVEKIESTTRSGSSFVFVTLQESAAEVRKEFDDIKLKLDAIADLPEGAGPIQWVKDFGDTAALMLTVASPKVGEVQVSLRARAVQRAVERARSGLPASNPTPRVTIVYWFPASIPTSAVLRPFRHFVDLAERDGVLVQPKVLEESGFVAVDAFSALEDAQIAAYGQQFIRTHLRASELHPDVWPPVVIRDPADAEARLMAAAGDKYTYRELEEYTDLIKRTLQTIPQVSKVERLGLLEERIYLNYSQERLASYGIQPLALQEVLSARNIPIPGGQVEVEGKILAITPTGEFKSEQEIGDVIVTTSQRGTPLYLRDLVEIVRSYESPPRYLNAFTWRGPDGNWQRTRAVTLSVQMRPGQKIGQFGLAVDEALGLLRQRLPEDLIFARTSDQPLQVEESIHLFMNSLLEAIVLVVAIALLGFWEVRSALLLAISIPLTLAMTFGMMAVLGIDLQQVSIASLIIALGLLVDDPVVANDAIKRDLALGHRPLVAAWLGPTKLATAILFATITNIVAYLPFLMLSGDTGMFLYSLPVVLTCSLVASRIVSMTFIPLLGYYVLRPGKRPELAIHQRRERGFAGWYYRAGRRAIERRWLVFGASLLVVVGGFALASRLKTQFFPKDLSYLSYANVWLPEDAPLSATLEATRRAEELIRAEAERFGANHPGSDGRPRRVLHSLTSFIGGGGPRFWFSVSPEPRQQNYAQIVIQLSDKHDTPRFVEQLQASVSAALPGVRFNAHELENGPVVGTPVAIRISGADLDPLRAEAEKLKDIFRAVPIAERVQDDWGSESFVVNLDIDPDRANLAGITNYDVAISSILGMIGLQFATLREGDKQIPVVARLRMEERAQLTDLQNLYVYSSQTTQRAPLRQISRISTAMQIEKLKRRNQFRTITVSCFPVAGTLPSEVFQALLPALREFEAQLPPGYKMEIAGEQHEQEKGFLDMAIVMAVSIACIFLALVVQFNNAVKPLIVFAAIPYGMVGAFLALWIMGAPFGFMAFLGVASLVGVIVSHVIVLFDFIEEEHAKGAPLIEALLDAGIVRLRPVLITVGATVFALFPLASHGGPLWEPLCYAQIGGLTAATGITLLLVPVLYAIFVLDLKIVGWEKGETRDGAH
jgi:multidrug efflux pump subunit AcrB